MSLITEAKKGDEDALRKLFLQYRPVIYKLQNKYYVRDFDSEDWIQEGYIVCYRAINAFRENHGATFGSFYKCAMENHIRSVLRRQHALKRRTAVLSVSLEEKIEAEGSEILIDAHFKQNYALDNLIIRETLAEYEFIFSKLEKSIMNAYLLGSTLEEIAAIKFLDLKKVRSAFNRAKKKLGKKMNEDA